jgi:hypothetical protein
MDTQPEQPAGEVNLPASASLILGVCSLLSFAIFWCGSYLTMVSMDAVFDDFIYGGLYGTGLLGLASLICGIIALVQIKKLSRNEKRNAITGIVLGGIECAVFLVLIVMIIRSRG